MQELMLQPRGEVGFLELETFPIEPQSAAVGLNGETASWEQSQRMMPHKRMAHYHGFTSNISDPYKIMLALWEHFYSLKYTFKTLSQLSNYSVMGQAAYEDLNGPAALVQCRVSSIPLYSCPPLSKDPVYCLGKHTTLFSGAEVLYMNFRVQIDQLLPLPGPAVQE